MLLDFSTVHKQKRGTTKPIRGILRIAETLAHKLKNET